jgi:hypothetical protein
MESSLRVSVTMLRAMGFLLCARDMAFERRFTQARAWARGRMEDGAAGREGAEGWVREGESRN